MQRSKATVSVEVKQVIGALCRLLAATGLEAVPAPETFRRAKFGGGVEVEDQFWQLLASILHTAGIVSCDTRAQPRGASQTRKLVAAGLWQTGYYADWMYEREGGEAREGGRFSSRDLLLALGWLLAKETLEKLLTQRVQQLDKTLFTPTPENPQLSNKLQLDSPSLRKLQWLVGSLRHQGRTLLSMLDEQTRLLHSVLFAILPSPSSSSDQHSVVLGEDCASMRQLCDLLEAYLNWTHVEKVFWTWMDSVMDCHLPDPVVKKPTYAPNESVRVCHHGNRGLEKLEDMLSKLPTAQRGQRRCRGNAEDRGGREEDLQGLVDISSVPPLLSSLPSMPSFPQVYRARLRTQRPVKHSSHPAEGLSSGTEVFEELPSSQAVELLHETEALLLERRDRLRLANRMWLQEMAGSSDELVLIPP